MRDIGRVVALAPDRDVADETRADLAVHGIPAEVVHAREGSYDLEDETLREHVLAGATGILIGLLAGLALGLVVVFSLPDVRAWDTTVRLLVVAGMGLLGTMPAMMWQMGRRDHDDDDPATTREVTATDWLVIVHEAHDAPRARRVAQRHGLVLLDDEEPRRVDA
ncbi:MAG TPA: hypothetical protein VK906_18005 [Egicoccus sp.]|nr:hypothetical protein [Egicoccus sp.]HSK25085.1 hypothetical protein [Egicoccus sp.]